MKAEHRHELKTNELVDWMTHFPQWARKNASTIIIVLVVIIAAVAFYTFKNYRSSARSEEEIQFTSIANQVEATMDNVLRAQNEGKDLSFMLLQPAENLQVYADTTDNKNIAALALIKRAEALRAELHYRMSSVTKKDITEQIAKAQESYRKALEISPSDINLVVMANYGLGLCAEELGDYDSASKIYQDIIANTDFDPTVAYYRAKYRLSIMDDFKQKITFKAAPVSAQKTTPEIKLLDKIQLSDVNKPSDANTSVVPSKVVEDMNGSPVKPEPNTIPAVSDTNVPG